MNDLGIDGDSALARTMSKSSEWHTPLEYVRRIKRVLGQIDLDPASCAQANRFVEAARYYDRTQNGLRQPWQAKTLFLNPPYGRGEESRSNQDLWSCKLIEAYEAGTVEEAILLINASTGTEWFQRLLERGYLTCLVKGRIRFHGQGKSEGGPTHDNAFVYFGHNEMLFCEVFHEVGCIIRREPAEKQPMLWNEEA